MSTDYKHIYKHSAAAYDRMVAAEDCDRNLLPAIAAVTPLAGAHVIEVGAGTGRVTRLLVQSGIASLFGIDESREMLAVAETHLAREAPPQCQWRLAVADVAAIPVPDGAADLAIAGWVFGHMTEWFQADWQARLAPALAELIRVTRPGGAQIILETLGTGASQPAAPTSALAAYYAHLETAYGFRREEVRTDYAFATPEEAASACGFFFGAEFAQLIIEQGWARVPEWTGLWWRKQPG